MGYALGFQTLDEECEDRRLPVDGDVPGWLSGALVRDGPAKFEAGDDRVDHWFDGLAMLYRFGFDDGDVRYTNRFLRSEAYRSAMEGGFSTGEFGTGRNFVKRLFDMLLGEATDNANVHVARLGGAHVAMSETPRWRTFHPGTLRTGGVFEFDDQVGGHHVTAHLLHDDDAGETWGYVTNFGLTNEYRLYRVRDGSRTRKQVASYRVDRPSYLHSFALTDDHVVLTESPFRVNPMDFLKPFSGAFIDNYEWRPGEGTRFLVFERDTGRLTAAPRTDSFFVFHHVNAHTTDDAVVVDLVAYQDAGVISDLSFESLATGPDVTDGELRRYRIPLSGGRPEWETLYSGMELPRVAPDAERRPYRYAYGQATTYEGANGLAKVDVESGESSEWVAENTFCEEPVFVPRPDADAEDDGVVLATALDADAERTDLLVLDAASFDVRARAHLPHRTPFGFHGRYFPET